MTTPQLVKRLTELGSIRESLVDRLTALLDLYRNDLVGRWHIDTHGAYLPLTIGFRPTPSGSGKHLSIWVGYAEQVAAYDGYRYWVTSDLYQTAQLEDFVEDVLEGLAEQLVTGE